MVDYDGVRLPLPVQALIGLLVQLQTIVQAEPDDVMAALLQIEAVATGLAATTLLRFAITSRRIWV